MAASSAPGTLYSSLAGIIIAAMVPRSSRCVEVREFSTDIISSIEQVGEAALHLVGDVERDGLDGGGRIDAARGHEQAAVDDEEILHIVRPAPFVDHRTLGVGANPRRAEQMPAAIGNRRIRTDVGGAGGFENLPASRQPVLHHLPAILADRVVDPRRRDPVAVLQHWIERDAVVLLGQILADRRDSEPMAVELAEDAVMIRAPRQNAILLTYDSFKHRPRSADELDAVATDEAARLVRVVKLLAPQAGRRCTVRIRRFLDIAIDLR